jgi:hypothetical protein
MDRLRIPLRRWPLRSAVLLVLVAAVGGTLAGAASRNDEITNLRNSEAAVDQQLADTIAELDLTNDTVANLESELSRANRKLTRIGDLQRRTRELSGEITDLRGRVAEEEAKLRSVRTQVAKSSFGDGTWQANVDFIPGTYQAPGGEACYWAKLSGPSGGGIDNIIDNGGFNNRPVVSVDSPYFETSGCGTWRRVG